MAMIAWVPLATRDTLMNEMLMLFCRKKTDAIDAVVRTT